MVRIGLEALVADLESVDAVEEEVRPLRDLLAELGSATRLRVPDRSGLERLREQALAVLRAFATSGAPATPGAAQPPTSEFWRR
jgi:hypothetical protein